MCNGKILDNLQVIIVVKLHVVIDKVNRNAEAVPLHRKNNLFHLENIVEHILVNVKEAISNLYDNHGKLKKKQSYIPEVNSLDQVQA